MRSVGGNDTRAEETAAINRRTGTATVLLIDDHPIVLAGLNLLLRSKQEYRVVGEATNAADACAIAARTAPDFIVADIVLGGRDGAELVEDLLATSPRSLVLSYSSLDEAQG